MARQRRRQEREGEDQQQAERQVTGRAQAVQGLALIVVFILGVCGIIGALWYRSEKGKTRAQAQRQVEERAAREFGKELVLKLYGEAVALLKADPEDVETGLLAPFLESAEVIDAVIVSRRDYQDYYVASASGATPKFGLGSRERREDLGDGVWMIPNGAYSLKGRQKLAWLFCKGVYDPKKPKVEIGRAMVFLEIPVQLKQRR